MLTQGLPWFRARIGRVALDLAFCLVLSLVLLASAVAAQANEPQAAATPAAATPVAATPVAVTQGAPLRVELNKLETAGEACKAVLIVENGKGGPIRSLRLDLYAFDPDGVVQKRSLVELGPVPARKTALRQFEISPTPCAQVGRVLLNDVTACDGQDLTRETCLERIEPASAKGAAPFVR
ncbi:Tat pathway signal protein [Methylobacterium nonmethylotrophicum]|uniref:Tat pathway signal protein n=1 Tax=Methylobacterium nonmethylotrophicum TaxID=1141884 RepID=A0A4Z0NL47_9HYPH|nr:Tat pathway signal protein [Methylobacterium nonmethylotrophicum]TGD96393.1 Tat pathway signal protein [Methylobacterium nonmethylotrophicum]